MNTVDWWEEDFTMPHAPLCLHHSPPSSSHCFLLLIVFFRLLMVLSILVVPCYCCCYMSLLFLLLLLQLSWFFVFVSCSCSCFSSSFPPSSCCTSCTSTSLLLVDSCSTVLLVVLVVHGLRLFLLARATRVTRSLLPGKIMTNHCCHCCCYSPKMTMAQSRTSNEIELLEAPNCQQPNLSPFVAQKTCLLPCNIIE